MQAKPADVELDDLRLAEPFEELEKFCLDFETEHLDSLEHSHIPYVVIVIKALHKWKADHDSQLPKTFQEKDEFKNMIKGMARDYSAELNFIEAVDKCFKAFNYEPVPYQIQEILDDEKTDSKEYHSNFWLYVSALKQFVSENGCLPVNGKVPDMTATSDFYISMQRIYQKKAEEDREKFYKIINKQIEEKGLMEFALDKDEIKTFCEN